LAAPVAPPKKKGTLKAKLAEKEAAKAAKKAAGEEEENDDSDDSDDALDPRARALQDKQRELEADMKNASELFGTNSINRMILSFKAQSAFESDVSLVATDTPSDLASLLASTPKTKDDFMALSKQIVEIVIKRHQNKPLYPVFVEQLAKDLVVPLRDVEIRKVASGLTTLANEKQREAKEKASSKKKKPAKPVLGGAKSATKCVFSLFNAISDEFKFLATLP
jgi:translation initiation factor 3 subunit J